ncbi:HAD family phosphatase [Nocardioides albidus]|uniref:HAD family phosphatase n=1 Tax=Nocardioides albidus TaxID=1517589 RepID=A0A5C4VKZ9_9ACTN|nr:HAD family phosphatase [Nocardioides albidus]TNM36504.1 HAD family phosphatase [Nocardioides albidus]
MSENLVDAVLFDYGGVLTNPLREVVRDWHAADGIEPESFTAVLRQWLSRTVRWATPIHRLETGELAAEEFEHLLAAELRTLDGTPVEPAGLLSRMFAQMSPDDTMFELAAGLKRCGVRVGLLSNSWAHTYPRERIDALFDPVVISGEIGLRKPQAQIYQHAVDRMGVPARRTLFVDDAEINIIGARASGLRGLQHLNPRCTRAALSALVPDLSAALQVATAS